jgi:hypothetical protein
VTAEPPSGTFPPAVHHVHARDDALRRIGSALAALLIVVVLGATPAAAHHLRGPCDSHRVDGESIQQFAKRRIVCAVRELGPVPGGAARAVCIAKRESGLNPRATSQPTGRYRGLFQHDRAYWAWRYDRYTTPPDGLSRRALNGRTNAIVTIRMVADFGTWKAAGWPPKKC